jgi:hypothetical protein
VLRHTARRLKGAQRREAAAEPGFAGREPDAGQGSEVRLEGLEPPTNGLEGRRSASELQAPGYRVARVPSV